MAFAVDRAVWTFGTCVEADMNDAENDPRLQHHSVKREQIVAARQAVWDAYMDMADDCQPVKAPPPKGRFADPAAFVQSR